MAANFWMNNAGTWRRAVNVWMNDAGTWRKAKAIWANDAGVWRKVFSGAVFSAISGSANRTETASGSKTATLTVNRDGTWQLTTNGAGGTTISPTGVQNWITPAAVDSGDSRWIKVTSVSGDPLSGSSASGVVIALTSNRSWFQTAVTSGDSFTCTFTVTIYADAGGTIQLSTGTVSLTATKG